jgi:hypothetical protein
MLENQIQGRSMFLGGSGAAFATESFWTSGNAIAQETRTALLFFLSQRPVTSLRIADELDQIIRRPAFQPLV